MDDKIKKQYDLCGITRYHEQGYLGDGVVILNHEDNTSHSYMTDSILKAVAPNAKIINAIGSSVTKGGKLISFNFEIDGVKYTPEQMYEKFKPDVMSVSFCGHNKLREERLKPLIDKGLVVCCATGNYGTKKGDYGMYADIAISIGSAALNNDGSILLNAYSGRGEVGDVTFVGFNTTGDGTSAATPFFAGMVALLMSRIGKMNQNRVIEIFKHSVIDAGDKGMDSGFGYGIPVLPELEEISLSKFKDVPDSRWDAEYINWASDKGIVDGFEDGTFRPDEPLTRGQMCKMLYEYDKQKGKEE